jgi:hypothetical protein
VEEAIDIAKAAGVGTTSTQVNIDNYFGFKGDNQSQGYGVLLVAGVYPKNYYDTYVFPQVTTEPIGFAFYMNSSSGNINLRMQMLLPDGDNFYNEAIATGSKNFSIVDLNGVQWTWVGGYFIDFSVISQAAVPVAYDLSLRIEGLNVPAGGQLYKDNALATPSQMFTEFATIEVTDEATFLLYNPTGLVIRDSTVVIEDVVIGGGNYSTIIEEVL